MSQITILWFRRDLRLDDNPALQTALATSQRLIPALHSTRRRKKRRGRRALPIAGGCITACWRWIKRCVSAAVGCGWREARVWRRCASSLPRPARRRCCGIGAMNRRCAPATLRSNRHCGRMVCTAPAPTRRCCLNLGKFATAAGSHIVCLVRFGAPASKSYIANSPRQRPPRCRRWAN